MKIGAHQTSSSMEEVAAQRPEEVRAPNSKEKARLGSLVTTGGHTSSVIAAR